MNAYTLLLKLGGEQRGKAVYSQRYEAEEKQLSRHS
jgi:hypothetical protein